MNAGKVNLGLLLIIVGVAAFAVNVDSMHWAVYLDLLELWPVLLIAIGVQMVFKRVYAPLAYISCLLIAVVGFWVLYDNYAVYGIEGGNRLSSLPMSKLDDSATRLVVDIDADDGELSVASSSSELIRCYYDEPFSRPSVKYETDGDVAKVSVEDKGFCDLIYFDRCGLEPDWSIKLHNGLPTTLKLDCVDSDLRLRLADFKLEELITNSRYSNVDVRFGSLVPEIRASMRVNRSDVRIRLPAGAGVEILNAEDFDDFFVGDVELVDDGDRFMTENFDSTSVRFSFDFEGNARILRIDYY